VGGTPSVRDFHRREFVSAGPERSRKGKKRDGLKTLNGLEFLFTSKKCRTNSFTLFLSLPLPSCSTRWVMCRPLPTETRCRPAASADVRATMRASSPLDRYKSRLNFLCDVRLDRGKCAHCETVSANKIVHTWWVGFDIICLFGGQMGTTDPGQPS